MGPQLDGYVLLVDRQGHGFIIGGWNGCHDSRSLPRLACGFKIAKPMWFSSSDQPEVWAAMRSMSRHSPSLKRDLSSAANICGVGPGVLSLR